MLKEHLDPTHDAASRRPGVIDEHVRWLHEEILHAEPTRILDLGCGPGLYAVRLASLGHKVSGIDISPASLEYARKFAVSEGVTCEFVEGDFRTAPLGDCYDLVMQIFGELNVFRRGDAAAIIDRCSRSLAPDGRLLFEVDQPEQTRRIGKSLANWYTKASGLFSDQPHLCLSEHFWNEEQRAASVRHWVIDAGTTEVTRYSQSLAAYEKDEYVQLFSDAGLTEIELLSDFPETPGGDQRWILTGRKTA